MVAGPVLPAAVYGRVAMRLLIPWLWPVGNTLAYWLLFAAAVIILGLVLAVLMSRATDDTFLL